jgi:hypothetical protein
LPALKGDREDDFAAAQKLKRLAEAALADDIGAGLKAALTALGLDKLVADNQGVVIH